MPAILAEIPELTEHYTPEITELRIIAKDPAVAAGLRIRPGTGTRRFFPVMPSMLFENDRDGRTLPQNLRRQLMLPDPP